MIFIFLGCICWSETVQDKVLRPFFFIFTSLYYHRYRKSTQNIEER